MAASRTIRIFFFLQVFFLLFPNIYSVERIHKRSTEGCVVCGKKSQTKCRFSNAETYAADFAGCFGFTIEFTGPGEICERCRRAVHEHRRNGRTFYHVSCIIKYNQLKTVTNKYWSFYNQCSTWQAICTSICCKNIYLSNKFKKKWNVVFYKLVDLNLHKRGRAAKVRQGSTSRRCLQEDSHSTQPQDSCSETVVVPKAVFEEMEDTLKMLSES